MGTVRHQGKEGRTGGGDDDLGVAEGKGAGIKKIAAAETLRKLLAEHFYELDRSDGRAGGGHHRPE
jgi:hypothetical protein